MLDFIVFGGLSISDNSFLGLRLVKEHGGLCALGELTIVERVNHLLQAAIVVVDLFRQPL